MLLSEFFEKLKGKQKQDSHPVNKPNFYCVIEKGTKVIYYNVSSGPWKIGQLKDGVFEPIGMLEDIAFWFYAKRFPQHFQQMIANPQTA